MATSFCASTSVLPAETYWPARIASPAANVGLADDAEAEEQVEGYQRRLFTAHADGSHWSTANIGTPRIPREGLAEAHF